MNKKEILDILDNAKDERGAVLMRLVRQAFDKLVQPEASCYLGSPCEYQNPNVEIQKERTKSHACDCISRQAAKLQVARVVWEKGDTADDFNDKCVDCLDDVQPVKAIPVSWIEGEISEMKSSGETSSYILGELISAMVRKWREENE